MRSQVVVGQPATGRNECVEPRLSMGWRFIAVMAAVLIGCGSAALLVLPGAASDPRAQELDQSRVVAMPRQTPDIADGMPDQVPTKGPEGAGRGAGVPTSVTTTEPNPPAVPSQATPHIDKSANAPETGTPRIDLPSDGPHPAKPTAPAPTTTPKPCFLWVIC